MKKEQLELIKEHLVDEPAFRAMMDEARLAVQQVLDKHNIRVGTVGINFEIIGLVNLENKVVPAVMLAMIGSKVLRNVKDIIVDAKDQDFASQLFDIALNTVMNDPGFLEELEESRNVKFMDQTPKRISSYNGMNATPDTLEISEEDFIKGLENIIKKGGKNLPKA